MNIVNQWKYITLSWRAIRLGVDHIKSPSYCSRVNTNSNTRQCDIEDKQIIMASQSPLVRSLDGVKKTQTEPNVLNVVLGNLLVKPWYPSFYPEELVGRKTERLYVCQSCFRYSKELMPYLAHVVSPSCVIHIIQAWLG